jgi:hypothetical protein
MRYVSEMVKLSINNGLRSDFALLLRSLSSKFGRMANHRWLSVTLVGLLSFIGSATVGVVSGINEPRNHDEFSYLLAADTFAHGRLTNPPHPMWIHFESFHILQQPTYQSKYPPAQGLVLAAGQIFWGHPIAGVWMSFALMCAAICWMLYAWVPPRWALMGGIFAIIHPQLGFTGYWAQSYWGSAVGALGGALFLGAVRRLIRRPHLLTSVVMALGFGILINSRPFEGLLVSLPAGTVLAAHVINKGGPSLSITFKRIFLPAFVLLTLVVCGMLYYNYRVSKNPLRLPYQEYEATYSQAPIFFWQKPWPEPAYRHQVMRDYHTTDTGALYHLQRSFRGFGLKVLFFLWLVVTDLFSVYLIPLFVALSIMAARLWNYRWVRFAFITFLVLSCGILSETYLSPHYFAPITALNYFLVLTAMCLLHRRDKKYGHFVLWFIPTLALIMVGRSLYVADPASASEFQRARLVRQLEREDGKHLIIVSYGPAHSAHNEWVYNDSSIDEARVVWARRMDMGQNCQLARYFKGRRTWSLEINDDRAIPKLEEFSVALCPPNWTQ